MLKSYTKMFGPLAILSLAAACGQNTSSSASQPPKLIEIKTVAPGTLFATFDPAAGFAAMQNAAKEACGSEAICKVIIFAPGTVLPTQFPMTDREVALEIGNYTLNRNSGADELQANCKVVKDTPTALCASAE